MAIIMKNNYTDYLVGETPLIYIDSPNELNYRKEVYNQICRYVREVRTKDEMKKNIEVFKDDIYAEDYNDIYYNKPDGYWFVEDKEVATLYKKNTALGYVYNGITVSKLFDLRVLKCGKVVPKFAANPDFYEEFAKELKEKVKNIHSPKK